MGQGHKFQATPVKDLQGTSQENNPSASTGAAVAETEPVTAKAMTQIDAAKLNEIAKAFQAKQVGLIQRGADGSITATFTFPAEIALVVESWAESAGEPLHEFCQRQLEEALLQFVEGT